MKRQASLSNSGETMRGRSQADFRRHARIPISSDEKGGSRGGKGAMGWKIGVGWGWIGVGGNSAMR